MQSKRTQTVISAALQQIEASGVVNVRNQVTKLLLKHVPKLTFKESELSRELLSCPDFAAWKMKRGWKRLKLPGETLEQPPLPAAVKAPKASQVWDKKAGRYVERKAAAFGAGVRGGIEKMRERLAAKDKELFERLEKADPSFVPHCKVFGEVDGVMWITCSNVGCKLMCRSKVWNTKKSQSCPDRGAETLRQEARRRKRTETVAERDELIFERQRRLNPDFNPHVKASVECNGRWYYVCKNAGCAMRVTQKDWSRSRLLSCKGSAPVVAAAVGKKVDARGRKRATRRSGDPEAPT